MASGLPPVSSAILENIIAPTGSFCFSSTWAVSSSVGTYSGSTRKFGSEIRPSSFSRASSSWPSATSISAAPRIRW